MVKRTHIALEADEQTALFDWAAYSVCTHPELKWLFAIPNGGSRNKIEAARLKRQGVKAGVSDMFLAVARGGYHGLWIELKRRRGGKVSDEQLEWIAAMQDEGYAAEICFGWDEAREVILRYLEGEKAL